jgi:aminoglycoside 2''-phosphotransferase
MDSGKLVSSIASRFPQLKPANCRELTAGWENQVLEINGEYIFRFPKLRRRWSRQWREIGLLEWLAPRLTVTVPHYEFIWKGTRKHPQKLAGYRKVPGVACTGDALSDEWMDRLGEDLGGFLSELHDLRPTGEVSKSLAGFERKSWLASQHRSYRDAKGYAYPLLDAAARVRAEAFWAEYLEKIPHFKFRTALCHSDLTDQNLIIDPSNGKLNGVIDWGDARIGDPAFDFAGLMASNPRVGEKALATYVREKKGVRERAALYMVKSFFSELAWGVWAKDERATKIGLRDVRRWLKGYYDQR